jgi:hypothetical protein
MRGKERFSAPLEFLHFPERFSAPGKRLDFDRAL